MRRVLILFSVFYLIINACSKPSTTEANNNSVYPPIDTIKNGVIDTLMYQLGRQWLPGPNFHTIHLNERDSVEYLVVDGNPGRISAMFYTDTTATWITVHQVKNEMKLMRFRQWRAKPQTNVQESISYFENGKIYYSRERNKVLGPEDQLGSFRDAIFQENLRKPEELMAEYMPYWDITKKALEQDMASRK